VAKKNNLGRPITYTVDALTGCYKDCPLQYNAVQYKNICMTNSDSSVEWNLRYGQLPGGQRWLLKVPFFART